VAGQAEIRCDGFGRVPFGKLCRGRKELIRWEEDDEVVGNNIIRSNKFNYSLSEKYEMGNFKLKNCL
ncbi:MAG: hypothetical protein AAB653_03615, partial [Patescibacteria group bacterium]